MNVAIIGYGKMGKTIEQVCTGRGHTVKSIIDIENKGDIRNLSGKDIQAAIEFTTPETAVDNITECIKQGIPVICGTTGWLDKLDDIKSFCKEHNGTFMYASNFSLGVNLFFWLNKYLANLMGKFENYKPRIEEVHHIHKIDTPSGTAITLAEGIIENHKGITQWKNEEANEPGTLPIISKREGDVPGTHTITFRSNEDEIEIKHTALGREGFALGAVLAAEWVHTKQGIFTMNDFLSR